MLVAVHIAIPAATHGDVGSGAIELAGIYSAGIAVEAVKPLEMSEASHDMLAAANTAAVDTAMSTADSAAANPATAPVVAQFDTAESYAAERSADLPSVVAETYSDT